MRYAGMYPGNSQVQNIWLNGESFANTYAKWWDDRSQSLPHGPNPTNEYEQEQLALLYDKPNEFSCEMDEVDFMTCADKLVEDVIPKLLRQDSGQVLAAKWTCYIGSWRCHRVGRSRRLSIGRRTPNL